MSSIVIKWARATIILLGMRMQGPAKGLHLARMSYENAQLREEAAQMWSWGVQFWLNPENWRTGEGSIRKWHDIGLSGLRWVEVERFSLLAAGGAKTLCDMTPRMNESRQISSRDW